jgi:hypothetical protein
MKHLVCLLVVVCLLGASQPVETVPTPVELEEAALVLSYAKSAKRDTDRLKAIMDEAYQAAQTIAQSDTETPLTPGRPVPVARLLFEGPSAKEAHALLLYAILYNETGMRPHLERCDCTHGDGDCDHGAAAGLGQVHVEHFQGHTKEEICADRKLQIELTSAVLDKKKAMCGSVKLTIGAYNAGDCENTDYAKHGDRVFQILLRKAQIDVRQSGKQWIATPREPIAER